MHIAERRGMALAYLCIGAVCYHQYVYSEPSSKTVIRESHGSCFYASSLLAKTTCSSQLGFRSGYLH